MSVKAVFFPEIPAVADAGAISAFLLGVNEVCFKSRMERHGVNRDCILLSKIHHYRGVPINNSVQSNQMKRNSA